MVSRKSLLTVALPKVKNASKSSIPEKKLFERTALFVPKKQLLANTHFTPSSFSPKVFITRDYQSVLSTIFKHGMVGERDGADGLEYDITRQQIIIYTVVRASGHVLWYQRTSNNSLKGKGKVGETRMQGKCSIGFGGHKTRENIQASWHELMFLQDLLPVIRGEIATIVGLQKGLFIEVEEELSIDRSQVKHVQLVGAFYDERAHDPSQEIQVEWVHTALVCILDIDEDVTDNLVLQGSEIAKAWWVPYDKMKQTYDKIRKDYFASQESEVEPWTGIVINEFYKEIVGE